MQTGAVLRKMLKYRSYYETNRDARVVLTERDRLMLEAVHRNRFLTSNHFFALTGDSPQQIRHRLRCLMDAEYLTRIEIHRRGPGSEPQVYALANRGAEYLGVRGKRDFTDKNRELRTDLIRPGSLRHTLAVADFLIRLEVACRQSARVEYIPFSEILANAPERTRRRRKPLRWKTGVDFRGRKYEDVGVEPDGAFGLFFPNDPAGRQRAYFFPEIDLGTQTVVPEHKLKPCILQKQLCYLRLWESWKVHQQYHPFPAIDRGWRVPFVTTSAERVEKFVEACRLATSGRGSRLFLFTDVASLSACGDPLEHMWVNGRGEEQRLTS
jgi:protein involved in plasmid replication-relaxation